MATTAETIRANIEAKIKALTPSANGADRKFELPPDGPEPEARASWPRSEWFFSVWHNGGYAGEYQHPAEFEAVEEFRIVLEYPLPAPEISDIRALDIQIRNDVHTIKATLDKRDNWGDDNVIHQFVREWPAPEHGPESWFQTVIVQTRFVESTS